LLVRSTSRLRMSRSRRTPALRAALPVRRARRAPAAPTAASRFDIRPATTSASRSCAPPRPRSPDTTSRATRSS